MKPHHKSQSSFSRFRQVRRIAKKHGLLELLGDLRLPQSARVGLKLAIGRGQKNSAPRGERLRMALEEMGPVFVKLGQALSTRPDLLAEDIALELAKLQDQVPAFPAEQSMSIIREAYGDQLDDIFENIQPEPLASASVAQVHLAKLKPGLTIEGQNGKHNQEVVIKVIRPGIDKVIESDLKVMYRVAGFLQRYWSRGKQFRPLDVIKEYDQTIHDELDLRIEAANGARMGANFEDSDLIYVPRIYWDYTHKDVLVMERIYGLSIREIETFRERGVDLKSLAADGVGVFFKQAFEDNFFHADMHAGNIFVSDAGKWIAIDFGIMGTLDEQDKQYLAEMLLGFFNRDYATITDAHLRAGWVPKDTKAAEFEQAIRVVCEPIFAKPLSEISFGNVLMQLFQTVRRFEMPVQPQLVLLYKTLLNIEGLGRQLYPDLNLWDTAKPFLEDWMKKQHSPQKLFEDFKRDWPAWQRALRLLPQAIENAAQNAPAVAAQQQRKGVFFYVGGLISLASATLLGLNQFHLLPLEQYQHQLSITTIIGIIVMLLLRRS